MLVADARADSAGDTTRQLIEALRANGTLTDAQYEELNSGRDADAAGSEAVVRTLIDVLHRQGTIDAATYRALSGEAEPASAEAPTTTAVATPSVKIATGTGGLTVESADGASGFTLGGRVHVDAGFFDDDDSSIGNATEVRRARIEMSGWLAHDWQLASAVDFGSDDVSLKSTYVRYVGFDPVEITVGYLSEPFGLERRTSANVSTFMERAAPTTAFSPDRNVGISASTHGSHWSLALGAFGEGADNANANGTDESFGVTGRATFAPVAEEAKVLHLGVSSSYRDYDGGAEFERAERWETHLTDAELVDTGVLTDVDDGAVFAAESAFVYGPVSLQGEYFGNFLHREDGAPDAYLDGWYAYASWVLTGESRLYSAKRGVFEGIKPRRGVGDGGYGAWELGTRFSELDLGDEDINGGRQRLLTVGLNWYARANIRFMANYVDVLDLDRPGTPENGDEPSVFQFRSQVNF